MASYGAFPSCATRYTSVVIGNSMPCIVANS